MKTVFVTRSVLESGINLLKHHGYDVSVWPEARPMTPFELHTAAKNVEILWCTLSDSIDKKFLTDNKHLKIIANYAVGTNNIDKAIATELGIKVFNTPDVLTEATAEMAFGLMIASARNFRSAMKNTEEGHWSHFEPKGFLGQALKGKTIGILGFGRIGKRMGEMCTGAFEMNIKSFKRGEDLIEFLGDLDVLSLHVPLTSETKHIIGKKEIAAMKPTAIIVNTARGDVIDQEALYMALKNNEIFSAGLDVTSPEPLIPSHPLYSLPNVIILPHIGSATFEAREAMSLLCANNIINAFKA